MKKISFPFYVFVTLAIVIALFVLIHPKASANVVGLEDVQRIERVLVKEGDTLSGIAERYAGQYSHLTSSEYQADIIELNNLSSPYITAGNYIMLPNYVDSH